MEEHKIVKTGTTTVGIVCKDGIVLAGGPLQAMSL
jgi:20S proteasome alpha/beta subunit